MNFAPATTDCRIVMRVGNHDELRALDSRPIFERWMPSRSQVPPRSQVPRTFWLKIDAGRTAPFHRRRYFSYRARNSIVRRYRVSSGGDGVADPRHFARRRTLRSRETHSL